MRVLVIGFVNLLSYCVSLIGNLCGFRIHHLILYELIALVSHMLYPEMLQRGNAMIVQVILANTFSPTAALGNVTSFFFSSMIEFPIPMFLRFQRHGGPGVHVSVSSLLSSLFVLGFIFICGVGSGQTTDTP